MNSRAKIVMDTDPMIAQPIWSLVSCSSSRPTLIKGAMPNQAKKHEKKANHVRWNVLIWGILTFRKLDHSAVALLSNSMNVPPYGWISQPLILGTGLRLCGAVKLDVGQFSFFVVLNKWLREKCHASLG
jgi:hypothetical protein